MAKLVLGLDIGSKYIKMAFVKQGKKDVVLKTIYAATPGESVINGEIKNADTVAARIRATLFDHKLKPSELYISINSQNVVVRDIKLPMLKEKEIDPAIEFELMQSFPGIIQTHTISSKIYSAPGMPIEGITAFCPNKILSEYAEVAKGLAIPLKCIDINANTLTKAAQLYLPQGKRNQTMIVVDIGYTMSQVNLVSAGRLLLSRQIPSGIVRFDNLVANRIGVSLDQAERARQNNKYDIYNLDKEDIDGFIKIAFSSVADQIRQIIDYYKYNKSDNDDISGILLFTGRGIDSSLSDYFNTSFGLKVDTLRPEAKESLADESGIMAIAAIGAALSAEKGKKDINLMPKLKEITEASLKKVKFTRILAVVLVIAMVTLLTFSVFEYLSLVTSKRIADTQQKIVQYSVINETKDRLRIGREKLTNANAFLDETNLNTVINTEYLDIISNSMPDAVFCEAYTSTEDGNIVLVGITKDRLSLADYVYELKKSDKIEAVVLDVVNDRNDESGNVIDYTFTLNVKIKKAGA